MSYLGNTPGVSSQRFVNNFVATLGQTTFTTTSGYSLGYVDVLVNGIELDSSDFTATDGSTVVLAVGANLGDEVKIKAWLPRGLSDGYTKSEADSRYATSAQGTNADTAYADRLKWDGGATGLVAATGRTSLGLGTAATTDSTAYATSAQGTKADTAYGWGNHASAGYQAGDADLTAISALAGTSGFLKKTAANTWSLDTSTYLTSYTETDPIYTASSWYTTTNNATNWNTAYGWGNHASAGYVNTAGARSAISAGTGLSYNSTTGVMSSTITQYTDALARASLSTTPGSGAYNSTTGVITIPTNTTHLTNGSGYITGNQNITVSGDISGSGTTSISATLATVNSNVGSYGSSTAIPVVTVNAKGLVTAVSTATVAGGQYFGSAATKAIAYNANSISENITITAGNNGLSAGPITINTGYAVTVETGANWVIV